MNSVYEELSLIYVDRFTYKSISCHWSTTWKLQKSYCFGWGIEGLKNETWAWNGLKERNLNFEFYSKGRYSSQEYINQFLTWSDTFFICYLNHFVKILQIRSFFWSVFSCIQTKYGDFQSKSFTINHIPIFNTSFCD